MAVYQNNVLTERPIYGSSRLGQLDSASAPGYRRVGLKRYELSNHLGNVLAVVSDRIRMKTDSTWTQVLSRTDYYPFGLEMTGRTESATYRYGFNGKEKDPSGQWSNQTHYDYGFRIYNPAIGKFLSVDPLTSSYPMLTPYQFASNRPIDGVDLDGLEYLRADEARIKVIAGKVHINLENFNSMTRGAWYLRNQRGNWPAGHIGWPTSVAELVPPNKIKSPESVHLDNGLLANEPNYIPGQHIVQNPIAASTNKVDKRFKNRTISGLSGNARGAGGFALALNSVTWGMEQYGVFANNHDMGLVEEHLSLLQIKVANDINEALGIPGMIPEKYRNIQDLGGISNVVLSGVNPTDNQDIYDIGIQIVKEISKNYRHPLQMHHYDNGPGQTQMDNTRLAPKVFPKYNEK